MTPLTPEQQHLAADPRAIRYAAALSSRFSRRSRAEHLVDELVSAGLVGVVLAARNFDPSLGAKFVPTWVHFYVLRELHRARRLWNPRGYRARPEGRPETVELPHGLAAGDDPVGWELEYEDEVLGLAKTLPRRHAEAVRLFHLSAGATMAAVGRRMGILGPRVSVLLSEAAAMLREDAA